MLTKVRLEIGKDAAFLLENPHMAAQYRKTAAPETLNAVDAELTRLSELMCGIQLQLMDPTPSHPEGYKWMVEYDLERRYFHTRAEARNETAAIRGALYDAIRTGTLTKPQILRVVRLPTGPTESNRSA